MERNEVYERIPWETLERKSPDRQWLLMAVAGAVVVGALAYSFMSNRSPETQPPAPETRAEVASEPSVTLSVAPPAAMASPTTSPVLVAEADLYAVNPERWLEQATAHAEWFVAEYFTVDGSVESEAALRSLLPMGLPAPVPPEDTSVFVEWVRTLEVEEIDPFHYRIRVVVRSLVAIGADSYVRQAPLVATVEVTVDETGPRVLMPPEIGPAVVATQETMALTPVPADVEAVAASASGASEILGGRPLDDGRWQVVVVAPGPDGVSRAMTVTVP
jgi:hypothetical protein